jgi:hypothetical protein
MLPHVNHGSAERPEVLDRIEPCNRAYHRDLVPDPQTIAYGGAIGLTRYRSRLDSVVDHANRPARKTFFDEVRAKVSGDSEDTARHTGEQPVRDAPLPRRLRIGEPPVLGEHHAQTSTPHPCETAVDERRIVVAVNNVRVVPAGGIGNGAPERRPEAGAASQFLHGNAARLELRRPRALLIETTHRHRQIRVQPLHELQHQALGAARVQAEHELQHPR